MRKQLLPVLVAVLGLVGCGGGSHHPAGQQRYATSYGVRAHSPTFGLRPKGLHPTVVAPKAVPTLEMFDTVTILTVPPNPAAVAGYTSGYWPTYGSLVSRFPRARHVSIAVNVRHAAKCLDVEPGDASPSQAGAWDRQQLARGEVPCNYSNLSEMPAVRASIAAAGLSRTRVLLWVADWTYFAHLDAGYDCTQWTDHALGRNLDESTCAVSFFGVKPAPPREHCFGSRHSDSPKCRVTRRNVAKWSRARDSTLRALDRRDCTYTGVVNNRVTPLFRGRGDCGGLKQRGTFFAQRIAANLY